MNTNHRSIQLQSGQALAFDRRGSGTLFLTEGEVLLQSPPEWLGDTVFQAPAHRVVAPAALPRGEIQSITALGAAKFHEEAASSSLPAGWIASTVWRCLISKWMPSSGNCAPHATSGASGSGAR